MFTGIIEAFGTVEKIESHGSGLKFFIVSDLAPELKIDQSLAHDGVCLTVVSIEGTVYQVDAIQETLNKTNLHTWEIGKRVNLERAMVSGARLDGHMVQGHVDMTAICIDRQDLNNSWLYTFQLLQDAEGLMVDKGSICVNGISLTLVNPNANEFSVAIIPYTFEHTNLHTVHSGDTVNIEFDILGKYIMKGIQPYLAKYNKISQSL